MQMGKMLFRFCAVLLAFALCGTAFAAEYPCSLIDQAGRQVEISEAPQRIVSGYYISTSACIALGLEQQLCAIEKGADKRNIYALAAPELKDLPNVGSAKAFDLEACIKAEPDLVILPQKLSEQAEILQGMSIPVLLVYPESQELMEEMLMLIAAAMGAEERAQAMISDYASLRAQAEALTKYARKPAALILSNSGYLACAPGDMYQSTLITCAGGENAAAELKGGTWTEISYEQLLAMNPEYLLIPSEASYGVQDILEDEQLQALNAVENGNVYAMPSQYEAWDSPTTSGILGLLWTLNILHGDLYPREALETQVDGFYEEYFGFVPV